MVIKDYLTVLGFTPKNGVSGVYHKVYGSHGNYEVSVDPDGGRIDYGDRIPAESRTTQNFSQPENFVVLECVDRLLRKGYKPENIVLEKTWRSGHGTSGRLDICVNRKDGTPYMLVECKTFGPEFDRELNNIHGNGGQLFTYFQLSGCKADVLVLYSSQVNDGAVVYRNEIVKVEDECRGGDVRDIFEKWNKLTRSSGVFEPDVRPYDFHSRALTKESLKVIGVEDSKFIFKQFREILRHNVVSDNENAFNKMFNLFLCKVYDETTAKKGQDLQFQWFDGRDNNEDFQLRLTDLYNKGMKKFLDRSVSDFNERDFESRCDNTNISDTFKAYLLGEIKRLRLEKNNEFAFKEVYDKASFEENAVVVKEVVELLQGYKIRYNRRHQYLSDFFELLLGSGVKQEAGQFFTPVPVAQFIIKSLPVDSILSERLESDDGEILPYMIDYAAGSGHFITEYMHEIQNQLGYFDSSKYIEETARKIESFRNEQFSWAPTYVYGIEKDYRLVKVSKVGCYLHGDGLANIILSDGLANFSRTLDYKGKLHKEADDGKMDNQQFDILLSNPPYSVSSFRQTTKKYYSDRDFELYNYLTDNSSEIECLFVERAKQLLKDGGVAGVILPSSILSNIGVAIYIKTRELILRYFEIVAIAELGGNTFMATNTNTVVMFMRRRNNYFASNILEAVDRYFVTFNDVTINEILSPVAKYVDHVWEGLSYSDYETLLRRKPNEKVLEHDIFKAYRKKYSTGSDPEFWNSVIGLEKEKLFYFILAYPQNVVVVKSGEKDEEKLFLGYKFSNRRGNEGISPISGDNINVCTQMFDFCSYDNPEKASTYIYKAFKGHNDFPIDEKMQSHVFRSRLIDMISFERESFDKNISLSAKKKARISGKWANLRIGDATVKVAGNKTKIPEDAIGQSGAYPVATQNGSCLFSGYADSDSPITDVPLVLFGDHSCAVKYIDVPFLRGADGTVLLKPKPGILTKYFYYVVERIVGESFVETKYERHNKYLQDLLVPIPPLNVQENIVAEMDVIENEVDSARKRVDDGKVEADAVIASVYRRGYPVYKLKNVVTVNPAKGETGALPDDMDVSFVEMASVSNHGFIAAKAVRPLGDVRTGGYTYFRDGDIIIAKITPCMENGKCALAAGLTNGIGFGSSEFHVFRADGSRILNEYLFGLLNRDVIRDGAQKNMTGKSGHRRVPISWYENLEIPVPPIEEQRGIVGRVGALEREIEAARAVIDGASDRRRAVLDKYL